MSQYNLFMPEMASGDLKGYDCDFVDPVPNSLVCLICTLVARAPQQMVCCGKVYCKACLSDLKASCINAICPQCRKKIESFPDMRGENDCYLSSIGSSRKYIQGD